MAPSVMSGVHVNPLLSRGVIRVCLCVRIRPFALLKLFLLLTPTGKYNDDLAGRLLHDGNQFFDHDVAEPTKLGRHLFGIRG
jgi:hypothetical protein